MEEVMENKVPSTECVKANGNPDTREFSRYSNMPASSCIEAEYCSMIGPDSSAPTIKAVLTIMSDTAIVRCKGAFKGQGATRMAVNFADTLFVPLTTAITCNY